MALPPSIADRAKPILEVAHYWRGIPESRHPASVYLAQLSPGSRRSVRGRLNRIAQALTNNRLDWHSFPWDQFRHEHVAALRMALVESQSPGTVNATLSALRGVLRSAWRLEYVDYETLGRTIDIRGVPGSRLRPGRALSQGELAVLFESCAQDPDPFRGTRDAALLGVLYGCGLRRAEAASLTIDSVREGGLVVVRKGNTEQMIPMPTGTRQALHRWTEWRGEFPGPLLQTMHGHALRGRSVYDILKLRGRRAAIAKFSPHDLRRSYVSDLLSRGCDLATVQRLAGHRKIDTTAGYDRRGEDVAREAVGHLHVPFQDRVSKTLGLEVPASDGRALATEPGRIGSSAPAREEAE